MRQIGELLAVAQAWGSLREHVKKPPGQSLLERMQAVAKQAAEGVKVMAKLKEVVARYRTVVKENSELKAETEILKQRLAQMETTRLQSMSVETRERSGIIIIKCF